MTPRWLVIAKAEFKVQTSKQRSNRMLIFGLIFVIGVFWALVIAPNLMGYAIREILGIPPQLLSLLMPETLRAGLMFIWLVLIIFPLANALKDIKIGQWEILLASNASTRDIFLGSFLGKLPINGLLVLFLAPLLISPFALSLEITFLGQALIYGVIFLMALGAIWLADLFVTILQAKLSGSDHGQDFANALAILLGLVTMLPLMGFQLFASQMLNLLGLDIFLWFPFTWSADLSTSIAVQFAEADVSSIPINLVGLDTLVNILFFCGYSLTLVGVTMLSINRVFLHSLEAKNQPAATKSNMRGSTVKRRRLGLGPFGTVIVLVAKDFSRRSQNIVRIGQIVGMSLFLPILVSFVVSGRSGEIDFIMILVMVSLAFALLSGQAFGAAGFLESQDQLWLLQTVSRGTSTFVKARTIQAILLLVPCGLLSSVVVTMMTGLAPMEFLSIFLIPLGTGIGSAMIAIGVTASNPIYDDSNSSTLKGNVSKFMALTILSFMSYTLFDLLLGMVFGLGELTQAIYANSLLYSLAMFSPVPIIGVLVLAYGTRKFSTLE